MPAIVGVCLLWGIDNNLTERLSIPNPVTVVRIKALLSGLCMVPLSLAFGAVLPPTRSLTAAPLLGSVSYGASLALDAYALRLLGAAREAAFFATAPFVGALLSGPLLGEAFGVIDLAAGALMVTGVVLLPRESHSHRHRHEPLEHEHEHVHDEHHHRSHEGEVHEPHSHPHRHDVLRHDHAHASDVHHRHGHPT